MRTALFVVLLSGLLCAGCEAAQATAQPSHQAEEQTVHPSRLNGFATELYKTAAAGTEGNAFLSPYSVAAALAMTSAGAEAETRQQMLTALGFPGQPDIIHSTMAQIAEDVAAADTEGALLEIANALWVQDGYDLLNAFVEIVKTRYEAGLGYVDFRTSTEQARQTINGWVEQATQGKIRDLLPPGTLTRLTRLVLTNAIYFSGKWQSPFDEQRTQPMPFHPAEGETKRVPMMRQSGRFGYSEGEWGQALELPYGQGELSMVLLLPPQARGLKDMETSLDPQRLREWLAGMRRVEVDVAIPRFEMTAHYSLKGTLNEMGMSDAFCPQAADFSGMNGRRDLHIMDVIHKAYVKVDEEGTEAAAATGVVVGITALIPPKPVFRADRPFLFLIRHRPTGTILFLGRITDPTPG